MSAPNDPPPSDEATRLLRMGLAGESQFPTVTRDMGGTDAEDTLLGGGAAFGALPEPPEPGRPGEMIGPYLLIEVLGEGGFGVVWRAEQKEPIMREVALKVIKPGMDSREIIARFTAERQVLALMDHPNIAAVLDAGKTADGRPYFAMELVRGVPITDYCNAERMPVRQRLELFVPICQAVQHAHQKGVLHRDIKPSNILVEVVDGKPVPKVIDFGIAKALQTGAEAMPGLSLLQTQGLAIIGTPLYMSPEQAGLSGQDVDSRSDIYSLGTVLYELLTGTTPLTRAVMKKAAMDEVLRLIREQDPPSLERCLINQGAEVGEVATQRQTEIRRLKWQVRGELGWIVLKALEKNRERRYASAAALAQDLEHHLKDEPVAAGPPGAAYRLSKLARRYRGPLTAAALVMLSLLAGLGFTIWQAVRATQAEHLAESRRRDAEKARDAAENLVTEGIHGMHHKLLALGRAEVLEDMVKAAENYFHNLPPDLQHNDETQRHLAALAMNRAFIALALGREEEHRQQTAECLRIVDALLAKDPNNEKVADEGCYTMVTLCFPFMESNDPAGAIQVADAVSARCTDWLKRHPDTLWAMYYQVLANNLVALMLVREMNQPIAGQMRFMMSTQLTRRMREVHGDDPRVLECEGMMHAGNARVADRLKQEDMALREFEASAAAFAKAIQIGGESALRREAELSSVHHLGAGLRRKGLRLKDSAMIQRGETLLAEAWEGRRQLADLEPGRGEWRRELGYSHAAMASVARDAGNLPKALELFAAELQCRDDAVRLSPKRPMLYEERATTLGNLARLFTTLPEPDPARAAELTLRRFADARRAIELNGMKVANPDRRIQEGARLLAEIAKKQPEKGLAWLELAAAVVGPIAAQVDASDLAVTHNLLTTAQAEVLGLLNRNQEAAALAQKQAAAMREQKTANGLHEMALAAVAEAESQLSGQSKVPESGRAEFYTRVQTLADEGLKRAAEALAKEPGNPKFRETRGRLHRILADTERTQRRFPQAAEQFAAAAAAFDVKTHWEQVIQALLDASDAALSHQDHAAVRKHLNAALAQDGPAASPRAFYLRSRLWTRLAEAERLSNQPVQAIQTQARATAYGMRACDLEPGNGEFRLFSTANRIRLASYLAQNRNLPQALELTVVTLDQVQAVVDAETDAGRLSGFADQGLYALYEKLRTAGLLEAATDTLRAVIRTRQRMESLRKQPPEIGGGSFHRRISLASLLAAQKRPEEADAEIKAVIEEAGRVNSPALLADVNHQAQSCLQGQGRIAEAEAHALAAFDQAGRHDLGWRRMQYANSLAGIQGRLGRPAEGMETIRTVWDDAAGRTWPGEPARQWLELARRMTELLHQRHLAETGPADEETARLWVQRQIEAIPAAAAKDYNDWTYAADARLARAARLAEDGQTAEYEALRRQLLQTAPPAASAGARQRAVLAVLLLPLEGALLQEAARTAAELHAANPGDEWTRLTHAAALLRGGQAAEALALLKSGGEMGEPGRWLVLQALSALAAHHSGDAAAAQTCLQRIEAAEPRRQRHLSSPAAADAMIARTLLRELRQFGK